MSSAKRRRLWKGPAVIPETESEPQSLVGEAAVMMKEILGALQLPPDDLLKGYRKADTKTELRAILAYHLIAEVNGGMGDVFPRLSQALIGIATKLESAAPDDERASSFRKAGEVLTVLQEQTRRPAKWADDRIARMSTMADEVVEALRDITGKADALRLIEPDDDAVVRFNRAVSFFADGVQRHLQADYPGIADDSMDPTI